MKRMLSLVLVLAIGTSVLAQESDVTTIRSETQTVSAGADLLTGLWLMEDAIPVDTNTVDLRLGLQWVTASAPGSLGDSSDDFILTPAIFWGAAEDLELSLAVGTWVGDGGDMGAFEDGNYDSTFGLLWRIHSQGEKCDKPGCFVLPSIALASKLRLPTGCDSDGFDFELRLAMTNEYDSGVRSHLNVFGKVVDNESVEGVDSLDFDSVAEFFGDDGAFALDPRDFQYGFVLGADGPLCGDGAVRWAADYMYRSSYYKGQAAAHMGEVGWEWAFTDADKFGMSVQASLDGDDDNINYGAGFMYSHSLAY